jgi:hypothetical protein
MKKILPNKGILEKLKGEGKGLAFIQPPKN